MTFSRDDKLVVANILVDQRPRYAEFSSDGRKLWVTSEIGGTISIIDIATRVVEAKMMFANFGRGGWTDPSSGHEADR